MRRTKTSFVPTRACYRSRSGECLKASKFRVYEVYPSSRVPSFSGRTEERKKHALAHARGSGNNNSMGGRGGAAFALQGTFVFAVCFAGSSTITLYGGCLRTSSVWLENKSILRIKANHMATGCLSRYSTTAGIHVCSGRWHGNGRKWHCLTYPANMRAPGPSPTWDGRHSSCPPTRQPKIHHIFFVFLVSCLITREPARQIKDQTRTRRNEIKAKHRLPKKRKPPITVGPSFSTHHSSPPSLAHPESKPIKTGKGSMAKAITLPALQWGATTTTLHSREAGLRRLLEPCPAELPTLS